MSAQLSSAKPRRRGVHTLVALGSIVLLLAILATWIRAQVLDTNGWTQTSVRLLSNAQVRSALAGGLSERLLDAVDVEGVAAEELPPKLAKLAPALSAATAAALPRAVDRTLALPAVQTLWAHANRRAHERVLELLEGGGSVLSTSRGVVEIDLEELLSRVGRRVGVGSEAGAKLPPSRRQIVLLKSRQLRLAQDAVKALRDLSFILPLLAALLYLGALLLGRGARRQALLEIGIGVFFTALLSLLLRRWIESYVVDGLIVNEANRPAVGAIIEIATSGWRDRALWLLVTGLLVVCAAWLAGPMRAAVWLRAAIAGPLERHPAWFLCGAAGIVLLVALLGPGRTPGQAIPLAIELALAIAGVLALRRQVIDERRTPNE
ncbi:MAG TPA: hypothetical protein VGF95_09060 [Solirubrobacteraceae bacterium]|jgi:hypothetical protein